MAPSGVDYNGPLQNGGATRSARSQAPCLFPAMTDGYIPDATSKGVSKPKDCPVNLDSLNKARVVVDGLGGHQLNAPWVATISAAWSLVLAQYTSNDDVSFYLVKRNAGGVKAQMVEASAPPSRTASQLVKNIDGLLSTRLLVLQDPAGSVPTKEDWPSGMANTAIMFDEGRHGERCEVGNGIESAQCLGIFEEMHARFQDIGLLLLVSSQPDSLSASLTYHPSLLSDGQAVNVASLLAQVLKEVVRAPELAVKSFNYMSDEHLDQIWRFSRQVPEPWLDCFDNVVNRHIANQPSAPAIDAWDAKLTYQQLGNLSTRLGKYLQARGVGPGVIVPLCFERSAWPIVAMLSVAKAGGAFVSVPPYLPQGRKDAILETISAPILLTTSSNSHMWEGRIPWTAIEDDRIEQLPCPGPSSQSLGPQAQPADPLYVIFTSGSTGAPKGVLVSNTSYLSGALLNAPKWNYGPHSRVLQMLNHTFDMSLLEILTGLGSGACVCVPHSDEIDDSLAGAINKYNVNHAVMTPSLARALHTDAVPGLKTLCLGGEAWPQEIVSTWSERITLNQFYGPSECSINSTTRAMTRKNADPLNIGPANAAANWVVKPDYHHALVPIGVQGELLVSGPIVGLGYLKNPEKTAKAFVQDVQFVKGDEQFAAFRFYKTGDLVRQNSDGTFTFCGRTDSQVKLNGQRIELGEVEYHLALGSNVQLAIAMLPKDGRCRGNLVAVISLNDGPQLDPSANCDTPALLNGQEEAEPHIRAVTKELRTMLHRDLPRYMVPTVWVFLRRMPMSPSGKIDRVSLDRWIQDIDENTFFEITGRALADRLETRSKLESDIQGIWADVLQLSKHKVGRHRPFVSFGGDSIQAQAIVARCRKQGISLKLIDILVSQGVAEASAQASYVESSKPAIINGANGATTTPSQSQSPPPHPFPSLWDRLANGYDLQRLGVTSLNEIEDIYPATAVQEDLLLGQCRRPGAYHMRFFIQVVPRTGQPPQLKSLQAAWESVIARHGTLRTVFVDDLDDQSGFHSVVLRQPRVEFHVRDVSSAGSPPDIVEELSRSLIPFDQHAPLLRLTFCASGASVHCFMFEISHALIDGAALEVIIRDLVDTYNGRTLPSPSPTYRDFVAYSLNQDQEKSLRYWTGYMENAPPCLFPVRPNISQYQPSIQLLRCDFEYGCSQALESACKEGGVTVASAVQAAWSLVLRTYTGMHDVSFAYLATGRNAPVDNVENMVGLCLSMLPCRANLGRRTTTLMELARSIQLDYTKGLHHQHLPLSRFKQQVCLKENGGPIFNTVIAMEIDRKDEPYADSTIALQEIRGQDGPTDYDLATTVKIAQGKLTVGFLYWPSIDEFQIDNVGRAFLKALDFFVQHHDMPVNDLSLGDGIDAALTQSYSASGVAPANSVLGHLEQQAVWHPKRPAVSSWDGELTHDQLSQLSSRLARQLVIDHNVNRGDHVLVCLDKSSQAVITLLAIAKTGAVFVPLNPKQKTPYLVVSLSAKSKATMIITDAKNKPRFDQSPIPIPVMTIDQLADQEPPPSSSTSTAANVLPEIVEEDRLAVLFDTNNNKVDDELKGVVVDHGSFAANVLPSQWKRLSLSRATRTLQFACFCSYVSLVEIFTTLAYGGCVCVPAEDSRMDDLIQSMAQMEVNWCILPPSVSRILDPSTVPGLEDLVLLGEEPVLRRDVARWAGSARVYHAFGVAETAGLVSVHGPLKLDSDLKNIGHAMSDDIRFWITESSDDGRLAPLGSTGRLVIESPRVTPGYLGNESSFSACSSILVVPVWRSGGSGGCIRMYKTDHLARFNEDQSISLMGRRDEQVILAGQRIDLNEINQHVYDCWPRAQAVSVRLIKWKDGNGSDRDSLLAFIGGLRCFDPEVLADDGEGRPVYFLSVPVGVTKGLAERLPAWMVPTAFFGMPNLPLVPDAGAIDHEKLQQIGMSLLKFHHVDEARKAVARQGWAEATETEKQLQDVFCQTLKCPADQVRLDDSFFDLGGCMNTAKQFVRAAKGAGLNISLSDVFRWASIRKLARMLSRSPTTPAAIALQQIWGQTLNIPPQLIGLDDNFLEMSAKLLVERARREGQELCVAEVYKSPRLDLMASTVEACSPFQR